MVRGKTQGATCTRGFPKKKRNDANFSPTSKKAKSTGYFL